MLGLHGPWVGSLRPERDRNRLPVGHVRISGSGIRVGSIRDVAGDGAGRGYPGIINARVPGLNPLPVAG